MKNTAKRKIKEKSKQKKRSHSDVMNDTKTFGTTERLISAQEHAQESENPTDSHSDNSQDDNVTFLSVAKAELLKPKFDLKVVDGFFRDLAKTISSIESLTDVDLSKVSEEKYRTAGLSKRYERLSDDDLGKQLGREKDGQESGLLNPPVIYKNETRDLYCVSGWKRIMAAKKIGIRTLSCRVVCHDVHVGELLKKYSLKHLEEVDSALKSAFSHIVYSEAIHTSPLSDMALLNYFHQIRENHAFERNNFRNILQFLGLERKSPKYNDLQRLWYVACEPVAYRLVTENKVRLRVFKKNFNISVMHHTPEKAHEVGALVDNYVKRLRRMSDTELAAEAKAFELDGYKDNDIDDFILKVDQPGLSQDELVARKYRSPRKIIKRREKQYEFASFKIDFENKDRANARQIVETLYLLEHVVHDLRDYADNLGKRQETREHSANKIVYGEKYFEFIRKYGLWEHSNIVELAKHVKSVPDSPIAQDEWKKIENLKNQAERVKKYTQVFREFAIKKDANQVHREHVETNATDEAIAEYAAPPIIDKDYEDEVVETASKKSAKIKRSKSKRRGR